MVPAGRQSRGPALRRILGAPGALVSGFLLGAWRVGVLLPRTGGRKTAGRCPRLTDSFSRRGGRAKAARVSGRKSRSAGADAGRGGFLGLGEAGAAAKPPAECPAPGGGRCGLGGQGAAFWRCALGGSPLRPASVRSRSCGDGAERGGPGKGP